MEQEISYKAKADASIRDLLLEFECQPILFVGSGISRRYFGLPTWHELLKKLFELLPRSDYSYEYYMQKYNNDPVLIGSYLSTLVFEWAWSTGKKEFPDSFFMNQSSKDIFIKYIACKLIKEITPELGKIDDHFQKEIESLSDIKPHAIITTNYDFFLEKIFDGYEAITGQKILRYNTNSFGEIFHIHGDVSDTISIVLTDKDYEDWDLKKKYISAKLLTYFAEHPVFIFGYGLNDPNVKSILRDIGELVSSESGLITNVYQIIWHEGELEAYPKDQAVFVVEGKEYRINAIHTNELKWIFDALKSRSGLTSINPKLVRALAARTMKLIRHDIPSGNVAVNYDTLERVANDQDHLATLLGITIVDNPNKSQPYTLTQVAQKLQLRNWHRVNKLINRIKEDKGTDLRSSDNRYHCKIRTGTKSSSAAHKWSNEAIDLFNLVKSNAPYELKI